MTGFICTMFYLAFLYGVAILITKSNKVNQFLNYILDMED